MSDPVKEFERALAVDRLAKRASRSFLDELATKHVGDSGSPNMFFVSKPADRIVAIIVDKEDAIHFAETTRAYLVEDRKEGEVWTSPEYDRLHMVEDDE